ncbi:MAG: hypothetical protein ACK56G_13250, partial [Pirellulaceae bacterium]
RELQTGEPISERPFFYYRGDQLYAVRRGPQALYAPMKEITSLRSPQSLPAHNAPIFRSHGSCRLVLQCTSLDRFAPSPEGNHPAHPTAINGPLRQMAQCV